MRREHRVRRVRRGADERFDVAIAQTRVPDNSTVLHDRRRHPGNTRLLPQRFEIALEQRDGEVALRPRRRTSGDERHKRDKNDLYGAH